MTTTLHIRQDAARDGRYPIRLTLKRRGHPDQEAEALVEFALTDREQEDLRWYLEDYLRHADVVEPVVVEQIEERMKARGEELYTKVLDENKNTRAIWFSIRDDIAELRVEIAAGVAEAASIPWELMRDPKMDSAISLRVKSFVRVQSNPNISFVSVPPADDGRIRLLYIACRPGGSKDVELRAVANRLLQGLGEYRARIDVKALRPPKFEKLQRELADAKQAGRPYHIVHFDGHGVYADLSKSTLAGWLAALSSLTLGSGSAGKHGYLLFEHPGDDKMRPVDGQTLGHLLHDNGVPVLVLNACQSAMHEAAATPQEAKDAHDEVRAIGSLAQAVVDQGIPAVLGMRYSVYVVTAAQYIGELYRNLAAGRSFGQAATDGRKHLKLNPERWVGLQPRMLQDWFVPVVYEAAPIDLFPAGKTAVLADQPGLDPVEGNRALLRYVPDEGFIGRDETILALDRAFDGHRVVLLHAYAGQGKSSTAVEFARWYCQSGGLGTNPIVLLASFDRHLDLTDLLNQIGQSLAAYLRNPTVEWIAVNDPEERLKIVRRILREIPVLWLWDNVEPVAGFPEGTESQWTVDEQRALRDFLQQIKLDTATMVKILLTSRRDESRWLGGIPHRIAMARMSYSDSAKFAIKLGEQKGLTHSEIANWHPLLMYCAGNPLTLRVLVGQAVKAGLRGRQPIGDFVEAIRSGEQQIEDADETQGRDRSLGASLAYGFHHAFTDDELPIIALLHLFQGTVSVAVLDTMSRVGEYALAELSGWSEDRLTNLLERAKETGLVTQVGPAYFTIHPALPWFLSQLFTRHYDGKTDRSGSQAALRAWVEAIGVLGNDYHSQFVEGNRWVILLLELQESNLLQAWRIARRHKWWTPLVVCMQGLDILYQYKGRTAEWARLVEAIQADYCTSDDMPIPGLEDNYALVMMYRVALAQRAERDINKGTALQEKLVRILRQRAALLLALPEDAPINDEQRIHLRTLAVCLGTLAQLQREVGNPEAVKYTQESIALVRRINDKAAEAVAEFNLGDDYKDIPAIRDLDASEGAYRRSLNLRSPNDSLNRSICIKQIGMVHHCRFCEGRKQKAPKETLLRHAQRAHECYLRALDLCPKDALSELSPMHNQLGNLYADIGQFDEARKHYEHALKYHEVTRN